MKVLKMTALFFPSYREGHTQIHFCCVGWKQCSVTLQCPASPSDQRTPFIDQMKQPQSARRCVRTTFLRLTRACRAVNPPCDQLLTSCSPESPPLLWPRPHSPTSSPPSILPQPFLLKQYWHWNWSVLFYLFIFFYRTDAVHGHISSSQNNILSSVLKSGLVSILTR